MLTSKASSLPWVPSPTSLLPSLCFSSTCHEKEQWECDQEPCLVDEDMIKAINQGNYG